MFRKYKERGFDALASCSLLIMVFLSAYSLESTHWTEDLNMVTSLACIGVILGIALGVSAFQKRHIMILSTLYSLILLFLFLVVIPSGGNSWSEGWRMVYGRTHMALRALLQGQPVPDAILFIVTAGILYWTVSLWAGFALIRKANPWVPLGVLGASLVATQFFQPVLYRSSLLTGTFFFLFLFLMGRLNFLTAHSRWKERKAYEDQESDTIFLRVTAILSSVLVLLAWGVPFLMDVATPGSKQHKAFIQTIEEGEDFFSDLFFSFRTQPIQKETVFGDTFDLGSAQPLGEEVLFTAVAPSSDFFDGNYYWKARSYSTYENGRWSSIDVEGKTIDANTRLELARATKNEIGTFTMVVNAELTYFYLPGNTISINRDVRITEMFAGDEDYDVIAWKPLLPLEPNDSYQSESYMPSLTYEMLQSAGDNYPARVKRMYLQLPEDFSERIQTLAEAITDRLDSDFEKTLAITEYLRTQMAYSTELGELPRNLDPVFWFLFEQKQGYCNYFASAEVLLLRSIGIPARLGVGYAQGVEIERGKVFEIRSRDSHAWSEVYFPEIGWVIFEPTSAQPAIHFPYESVAAQEEVEGRTLQETQPNEIGLRENAATGSNMTAWFDAIEERLAGQERLYEFGYAKSGKSWITPAILTALAGGSVLFLFLGRVRYQGKRIPLQEYMVTVFEKRGRTSPQWLKKWAAYRNATYLQRTFPQFDLMLAVFGVKNLPQRTPLEKATLLAHFVPEAQKEIEHIVQAYQQEAFGKQAHGKGNLPVYFRHLRKAALGAWFTARAKRLKKRWVKK